MSETNACEAVASTEAHAPHAAPEPGAPEPGTWVAQEEAAALCGRSYDTIRRYRRNNKLRSRTRADGAVEVPVVDLVACGLLDPLLAREDVAGLATKSRAERDLVAARQELAVLSARLEAATARAERAERETRVLQQLLEGSQRLLDASLRGA